MVTNRITCKFFDLSLHASPLSPEHNCLTCADEGLDMRLHQRLIVQTPHREKGAWIALNISINCHLLKVWKDKVWNESHQDEELCELRVIIMCIMCVRNTASMLHYIYDTEMLMPGAHTEMNAFIRVYYIHGHTKGRWGPKMSKNMMTWVQIHDTQYWY